MLSKVIGKILCYNLDNEDILREVIVKIGLEKIDMQEGVIVEALILLFLQFLTKWLNSP